MNKHATNKIISIINKLFKTVESKVKHADYKIARVASAVTGLLETGSVSLLNLSKFNHKVNTVTSNSLEQNSRRMLDNIGISIEDYAKVLVSDILELTSLEITIDRTNWEDGQTDINYFVLSIIWHDIAIPLYWLILDNKGGSSSDEQRISLVKWVVDVFGADRISWIYADREFPSHEFISYLLNDNRKCNEFLELDSFNANKLYDILDTKPTKMITAIDVDNNISFLKLKEEFTLIDTQTEFFLVQVLENNKFRIYPMIFANQYDKIKKTYNPQYLDFNFGSSLMSSMFKGFANKPAIKFAQRCKSSTLVSNGKDTITLAELHKDLNAKHAKTDIAKEIRRMFGNRLFVSAKLNYKKEFIFIVSSHFLKDPFAVYKRRWFIEVMFGKFKSMGFNLESTHIKNPTRLSNLFLLISIAYLCCCKLGQFAHSKIKPIKLKKLLSSDLITKEMRFQYSIFRIGFELLKNFINNRLFSGATMAKLIHKILDCNSDKLQLPKRSRAFKLLGSI
jgi:hypothetical protein